MSCRAYLTWRWKDNQIAVWLYSVLSAFSYRLIYYAFSSVYFFQLWDNFFHMPIWQFTMECNVLFTVVSILAYNSSLVYSNWWLITRYLVLVFLYLMAASKHLNIALEWSHFHYLPFSLPFPPPFPYIYYSLLLKLPLCFPVATPFCFYYDLLMEVSACLTADAGITMRESNTMLPWEKENQNFESFKFYC